MILKITGKQGEIIGITIANVILLTFLSYGLTGNGTLNFVSLVIGVAGLIMFNIVFFVLANIDYGWIKFQRKSET